MMTTKNRTELSFIARKVLKEANIHFKFFLNGWMSETDWVRLIRVAATIHDRIERNLQIKIDFINKD